MRRIPIVLLLILLFLCLFACTWQEAQAKPALPVLTATAAAPTAPTATKTPAPTPAFVEIGGQVFAAGSEEVTVTGVMEDSAALMEALVQLPKLKSITVDRAVPEARLSAWVQDWAGLETAYPAVSFTYRNLYRGVAAETVTDLVLTAMPDKAEMEAVLVIFPNLSALDLRSLACDRDGIVALEALAPTVNVLWTDETFGPSESVWKSVTVTGPADEAELKAYFACFPYLQEADLLAAGLSEEEGDELSAAFPRVALRRMVALNGKELDSFVETLNLTDARIADYDAFADAVGRFPKLQALDLSGCNLSNENLDALRTRYPQARVVWEVRFGRWTCRTDAIAFSTRQSGNTTFRLSWQLASVLRYCPNLVALDLGHNAISDISWLEALPKLQVLILADNRISDISPLSKLKHLKYVELFMNPIRDITPLASLSELLDVNLCITRTGDLSPLLACKKLERIWIGHQTQKYCSKESLQAVLEAFPDATYDLLSVSCTNRGWREHPRYDAYTEMFKTNTVVAPFIPEE